jgi:hypothetical protein
MTLFRTVDGVVQWFDNGGNPINPDGSPRGGPTLDALGGPDGSYPDASFAPQGVAPITPAAPPAAPSFANLNVYVTDASTGGPLAGVDVTIGTDPATAIDHPTDANGRTSFVVPIGATVIVTVALEFYSSVQAQVPIFDASDHTFSAALTPQPGRRARGGVPVTQGPGFPAPGGGASGGGVPPGIPSQIVLHESGTLEELTPVTSGLAGDAGTPAHRAVTFETRLGVPSITAESFALFDIGGFGPSPSGILTGIVGALLGLFRSSSGSADISRLSNVVNNLGQLLLQTVSTIADLAARTVHTETQAGGLFDHLLGGILGPIINALAALIRGGSGGLGTLFGPISQSLSKLLALVKHVYDTWLRPILKFIDTTRQILRVLEAFHLKWAAAADAALGRLEGKLSAPLLLAIQEINKTRTVVNRIVTLDGALQRVTLLKGLTKHATCVQRALDQAPMAAPGTYPAKLPAITPTMDVATWRAGLLDRRTT